MTRIFLSGMLFLLLGMPAVAGTPEETLQARAILWSLRENYRLDVVETWVRFDAPIPPTRGDTQPLATGMAVRDVRIRCIASCTKALTYDEEVPDMILGAFSYGGSDREFVTIWGGATSFWVRIYRVEENRIVKVMEEATRSAPQFLSGTDGATLVILSDGMKPVKTDTRSFKGQIWKFQSGRYAPTGRHLPPHK